jgi:5-methylcytosine-specific restriction protein A
MIRLTYVNEGWAPKGISRKAWAIENKKCAWCGRPLPKQRKLYCSQSCSLRFTEDPRYHKRMLLWSRIRAEVLYEHKVCQKCGTNPPSEVDHIREIAAGGDPFDKSNLQALCSRCHKEKTARFLSRRRGSALRVGVRSPRAPTEGRSGRSTEELDLLQQHSIDDF